KRPSAWRRTMNPPPPRLPAEGYTTARANCVAIAASTALPPALRMSSPTLVASGCAETTMAESAITPVVARMPCGGRQATAIKTSSSKNERLVILYVGKVKRKFLIQVKVEGK